MNHFIFLPLVSFFINFFLLIYIGYKYYKHRTSLLKILFLFFASLSIWCLTSYFTLSALSVSRAVFFDHLNTISTCFTVSFILHFVLLITENKSIKKWTVLLLYGPSIIFSLFGFTDLIVISMTRSKYGFIAVPGPLYSLLISYLVLYVLLSIFVCFNHLKKVSKKEKKNLILLIIALLIPLVGGVFFEAIPTIIGLEVFPLTTTFLSFSGLIFFYIIFQTSFVSHSIFNIERKIVLGVFVIFLGLFLTGLLTAGRSTFFIQDIVGDDSLLLTNEIIDEVSLLIVREVIEVLNYAENDFLHQELSNLQHVNSSFNQSMIVNNSLSRDLIDEQEHFAFSEIIVTNSEGFNVGQTGFVSDFYQADEEWWMDAKNKGLIITELSYDMSARIYSVSICSTIRDDENNFLGVFKGVWNVERITNLLNKSSLQEKNVYLLTKNYRIIYSSTNHSFMQRLSNDVINHINMSKEDYVVTDYDELLSYTSVNKYGLELILLIKHEPDYILRYLNPLINQIFIISIIFGSASLIISIIISNSIITPVNNLKKSAEKIGEGKMDTKINVDSSDEIGELADSFRKMRDELKELRESRKRMILMITHDLKQPLTPIHGYAGLLKKKLKGKKQKEYLDRIMYNSKRMKNMINRMLDLFRLEAGKLKIKKEKNDVKKIIQDAIKEKEHRIKLKNITIEKELKKVMINCDKRRIKTVFTNLIDNAVKFSEEDGRIEIKMKESKNNVKVSVRDYGQGIKKEDIKKLFKEEYLGKYSEERGGAGVGLTLVKHIVKKHNGKINVKSDYGKWTEFIIMLPK